ncbi:DEAD/DEAH box helicase [Viridibacillus sp. FSL R5-0477]|uniref:ATP-dependent RNA helicase DbpA n=1 Tax=Viridibacillus arenosi FSL R5-213 TaxID=1227360 RepID=W4F6Y1_9BACL|nr:MULTISPECIES: DEAD/DEAH box helicase [Viridibacillus]ETT88570.1 DEAD/DEAH box helicase [Viridibacillus arenosi FSL R5-213]OMC81125.1 RNA helicase [Viridibacillus sp. FSL H8-0123]OMC85123.1 RNA helicase [Viridibacillus sp. FSL H7-0596]OMC90187.1 RNA helicase [Viridibacillus arenosi]
MSGESFKDYKLSNEIVNALNSLEYRNPTEVQSKVIPLVLENKDLVVKSQTGSGKTASYGIPICELVDWKENKPQALILTPTRELAVQVKEDFTNLGRFKRIKATAVYGKQPFAIQKTELKQKTHVVVGTPGRVMDHIEKGTLALDQIRYLVIDEADEMLNMGFIEQVEAIIKELPRKRVTMLFSATLPEAVKSLALNYMKKPTDIEIKATGLTTDKIDHSLIVVEESNKLSMLKDVTIVENPDSCIIFCRTKDRVDTLCEQLADLGYSCDKIHGGMIQDIRLEVMNDFKRGDFRYLIATDVAARGIDIDNITHVINYDLPLEKESYVHRTGRTGRAGQKGKALTLVTPFEDKFLNEIEEYIGFKIPHMVVPSKEEVSNKKSDFDEKMNVEPKLKAAKNEKLNKQIMKLYFNGGKKKKLRAVDFVGTIAKINGVTVEDIGIITITDTFSYVEILNDKGPIVLKNMKNTTIKGKLLKVYEANKK